MSIATAVQLKHAMDLVPKRLRPIGNAPQEEIAWAIQDNFDKCWREPLPPSFAEDRLPKAENASQAVTALAKSSMYGPDCNTHIRLEGSRYVASCGVQTRKGSNEDILSHMFARADATPDNACRTLHTDHLKVDSSLLDFAAKAWEESLTPAGVRAELHRVIVVGGSPTSTGELQVTAPHGAFGLFFVRLGARHMTWMDVRPHEQDAFTVTPGSWGVTAAHQQLYFQSLRMPPVYEPKSNECIAWLVLALHPDVHCLDNTQTFLKQIPRPFGLLLEGAWEAPDSSNPSTANARTDHFRRAMLAAFGAQDVTELVVMVTVEGIPSDPNQKLPAELILSAVFPVSEEVLQSLTSKPRQSTAILPPLAGLPYLPFFSPQPQSGYTWSHVDGGPYVDSKARTVYLYNAVVVNTAGGNKRKRD